jgi:putative ABC transport system ATP-binding protein
MSIFSLKRVNFKNIICYPGIEISKNIATFICGESGCGKSTLLKLLCGVVSPNAGEIIYNSESILNYEPVMLRREVLLCGQSAYLFDGSIADNFAMYYSYRDLPLIDECEMKKFLGICAAEFSHTMECNTMSGGERQRVFTAICLSLKPQVLLLDEPTSALDDATANTMLANIKTFCAEQGITLIVVSHSKSIVDAFADKIIKLESGERHE